MSIFSRFDDLIKSMQELFDLEKGERKIVDTTKKWKSAVHNDAPAKSHDISSHSLSFHTGKIHYAPAGSTENPHDHATASEHVIIHNQKPIGYATVHHAHPRDVGRAKDAATGTSHEHQVEIHAPSVHPDAHPLLRAKVREHVNSKEFKDQVTEHNKKHYDYEKPKGGFSGGPKVTNKYR